ncbi:MAG: hypothetical protein LBU69_02245 [Deltaproteobacteria bacterium]|nr:hypothetical protein [Deltaproteobacteria bacterium]
MANEQIKLAYTQPAGGLALEAAISLGYFTEEGLEAQAVPLDPDELAKQLSSGNIKGGEVNYRGLKLAVADVPLVFTAGLYSGFVEILGLAGQPSVAPDKKIVLAAEDLGSGPAVAAARHYLAEGIDPDTAITWLETKDLIGSLESGKATAITRWELKRSHVANGSGHGSHVSQANAPGHKDSGHSSQGHDSASQAPSSASHGHASNPQDHPGSSQGNAGGSQGGHASPPSEHPLPSQGHGIADNGQAPDLVVLFSASASLPQHDPKAKNANPHSGHTSAHHLFDSFVVIDKNLAKDNPGQAAAITRALIRGAKWVGENQGQAASLGLEKGVWKGSEESLASEIARYMWMPGVSHAKEHLRYYIHEGLKRGSLPSDLEESAIFDKVFFQALPDVS